MKEIVQYIVTQGLFQYTLAVLITGIFGTLTVLFLILRWLWKKLSPLLKKIENACDFIDGFNNRVGGWESFTKIVHDTKDRVDIIENDLTWIKRVCDRRHNNTDYNGEERRGNGKDH